MKETIDTATNDFYEKWAEVYDLLCKDYRADISFYAQEATKAGGKVLEVACGTGRIYLELLKAGIEAYGFDLSSNMLEILKKKAAVWNLKPQVRVADMRKFIFNERFSLIMIPLRAFLHNLTADDQLRTLRCCRRHLDTNGKLMLNFFFPSPHVIASNYGKDIITSLEYLGGPVDYVTNSHFLDEPEQIVEVTKWINKGQETLWKGTFKLALMYKREFALLLRLAGFKTWELYGGFNYQPLNSSTQEMVWIVEK